MPPGAQARLQQRVHNRMVGSVLSRFVRPNLANMPADIVIRRAVVEEIIDLRHAVLRAGLPRSEAVFDGDTAETSRHYGGVDGATGRIVGCATIRLNAWHGEPAW